MKTMMKKNRLTLAALSLLAGSAIAAPSQQVFCVFDLMGANGDMYNMMKDYKLQAAKAGANIELKVYTDEKIATEDFKAGQCDGAAITGFRARQFNQFTGTIDSVGAIPSYEHMRKVLATISDSKAAALMKSGEFEIAGVLPMGSAYPLVRDRAINTVEKMSGKKFAVFDFDKSQAKMVQQIGAAPVASDITNFAGKFNNGSVDIVVAPALAYKPLELYKGVGSKGAVVRYPVVQLTDQLVIRSAKFPAGFGQKSREITFAQFDKSLQLIRTAEKSVNQDAWMELPAADKARYDGMMREARVAMLKDGFYHPQMLKLLKKVRCQSEAGAAECSQNLE